MTTLGSDDLETARQLVRDWSESNGKGLALSILIAKALKSEGDRRAAEMRARCVSHCKAAGGAGELLAAELSALPLDTEAK